MRRRAQPWLGTLVEITISDSLAEAESNIAFHHAFSRIAEIHRLMNFLDPASDVLRINLAAVGAPVAVDPRTYEVLCAALSVTAATEGVFDIACAPRLVEWGYLPMPDKKLPDYIPGRSPLVLEEGHRITKTDAVWIDLGGIAKGYAVDQAVNALKQAGVQSACVNAGGDLRAFGDVAYPVVIRDPQHPTQAARQTAIQDTALATSGSYFSLKQIGGHRFSALVNGRNGQPVTAESSASVCAPICMLADALTKLVLATRNPRHPVLERFGATAFII
jgi:thiamine biosynthesis lipoprotein